ncbi:MAG: hypothetical protein JF593_13955 [Novosphingobium sp.]|nr:hypothetical protein [Novosphingobium sp.]
MAMAAMAATATTATQATGYWGTNGLFYFRQNDRDRYYRQGDRNHFYRGGQAPGTGWRSMNGTTYPRQGYQMPNYPGAGSNGRTWQPGTSTPPGTTTTPGTTWQGRTWHRRY